MRVRVTVLLRVRLELLTLPVRLEEEGVAVTGSHEGELLGGREGLEDGLTGAALGELLGGREGDKLAGGVRLAEVVRTAETGSEGV